jgi:hypothetical protein
MPEKNLSLCFNNLEQDAEIRTPPVSRDFVHPNLDIGKSGMPCSKRPGIEL